jgi:putative DNA primase/helicase
MATSLIRDYPWTDAGNSERLIKEHGENVRYIDAWESWIAWHGSRWEVDKGYLYRMAELTARKMHDEAGDLKPRKGESEDKHAEFQKAAKAFARKTESASSLEAMIKLARYRAGVSLPHTKLDGNPMILPVRNGTIELATGSVRNSKREDYATLTIPIRYDEKATCPLWEAFLLRAMGGDEELVSFLQRCVGYSLTGSVGEHVLFFCHGPKGMNGKSTFLNVLREVVGGYGAAAPRKLLFQGIGDRHPTELTTLFGKRVVTCSEIPEDQRFDEALLKDLTGSDRISAHRMREDFWEYDPTHKLWLAGNHKPVITGTDGGIWRRIMLIPWEVTIPEGERDLNLTKKLRGEMPGILAWAVRGCLAWQKRRLDPPGSVMKATRQYRRESDLLGMFFYQCCTFGKDERVAKRRLRQAYEQWCEEVGSLPLGPIKFYRRLREKDCEDTSVREKLGKEQIAGPPVDGWAGVRLSTKAERAAVKRWDPSDL